MRQRKCAYHSDEALKARNQWQYARSISRRLGNGQLAWSKFAGWQRNCYHRYLDGRLAAEVVAKSSAYKEATPELEVLRPALGIVNPEYAWQLSPSLAGAESLAIRRHRRV